MMRATTASEDARSRARRLVTAAAALVLFAAVAPAVAAQPDALAPDRAISPSGLGLADGGFVPGPGDPTWIVTMAPGKPARSAAQPLAAQAGVQVTHVYEHVLNGFAFRGSAQAAEALEKNPNVLSVDPARGYAATERASVGMFRIDGDLAYEDGYRGRTADGTRVRIAVLDTGIDTNHPDLVTHLDLGNSINCITPGTVPEDDQGHGTHVAGIAAAADNGAGRVGVASQATIVAAKVLDGSGYGTDAQVICGLDHVAALAADGIPTVVNMSLGEPHALEGAECSSSPSHQAICNLTDLGVTVVAAAGNSSADTATFYPAAYAETIAVSAFTALDGTPGSAGCAFFPDVFNQCDETLASFSNWGTVVDVTAPGVNVNSTVVGGGEGTNSGTSMASPFAAGVAALVLAADPTLTPAQVKAIMQSSGECPDGSVAGAPTCAGHGQWQVSGFFSGTTPDPDGVPEPLINARRAITAAQSANGPDTTAPLVTITAPANGATYEAGATVNASFSCWDPGSGVASCAGDVADGAPIDTTTPGTGITFSVTGTDNAANADSATVTYDVVDTTPPVIILLGDDPMLHDIGTPFTDPGAEVTDNVDATTTVTGVSTVDPNTAGTYTVTYDATDAAGNAADQVVRTVVVAPAAPPAVDGAIDFTGLPITGYGGSQDGVGGAGVRDGGRTFELHGNVWKKVPLPTFITPTTVVEFDFFTPVVGEMHGFGFDNDDAFTDSMRFDLAGTSPSGIRDFLGEDTASGWVHYSIPVGQYYTGSFQYLYFVNDDDASARGMSLYTNVVISDPAVPPPPPPVEGAVDFTGLPITGYGGSQDGVGAAGVRDGGRTFELHGNVWKKVPLPTEITADTVIEFDFFTPVVGEMHGFGFDNDNTFDDAMRFDLAGTSPSGIPDFLGEDTAAGWVHYSIPIGQYYTGTFQYLYFVNDDDASKAGRSLYANVVITDEPPVQTLLGSSVGLSGDDVVSVGDVGGLAGDLTYELWVKPASFGSWQNPLAKAYGGEGTITQTSTGQLVFLHGTSGVNGGPYEAFFTKSALPLGEWTHVVVTRSGSQVSWYLNGVLDYQRSGSLTPVESVLPLTIGAGYTAKYQGGVDEVAVYDRALSQTEIVEHFVAIGDPVAYAGAVNGDLPVSYWRLDEATGAVAADQTGANPGLYSGTPGYGQPGASTPAPVVGSSVGLSGDDVVSVGDVGGLAGDLTYELWVKPASFGSWQNPLAKAYGGEGTITQTSTGQLVFLHGTSGVNGGPYEAFFTKSALPLGEWTHVVVTRSGSQVSWYLNGVLDYQRSGSLTPVESVLPLTIGAGYTAKYQGGVDEVAVYDRALSQTEIVEHFVAIGDPVAYAGAVNGDLPVSYWRLDEATGAVAADQTGANPGLYSGTPGYGQPGASTPAPVVGSSVGLSGDDVVSVGDVGGLAGDLTYELWVKPASFGSWQNPLAKAYGGEGTITQTSTGQLVFLHGTSGVNGGPYEAFFTKSALPLGEWTHVVVTRSGSQVSWYLNGVLDYQRSGSLTPVESVLPLTIGAGYTAKYQGGVDEVAVYDRALSQTEIVEHFVAIGDPVAYAGAVNGDLPVSYWRLDEATGAVAADQTGANPGLYSGTPGYGQPGASTP